MRLQWSGRFRLSISIAFAIIILLASSQVGTAQIPIRSVTWDQPMRVPSPDTSNSWFPDLAVDSQGNVHVVWSESQAATDQLLESVYYSTWNGNSWTQYNDIVAPSPDIRRTSLAIDGRDTLHLLYGGSDSAENNRLAYKHAPAGQAYSSARWSEPEYLNDRGQSYMGVMAVAQETIHLLYEDTGEFNGACPGCADIYYRSSPDLGQTWSIPVSLDPTPVGSARPHLFVDQNQVIYASWDEGFDPLSRKGEPHSGEFVYSTDGGDNWSNPLSVTYPNSTNLQLTVAANGNGGVMLVWRTADPTFPGVYYMWSTDGGANWSLPETLPNFQAVPFSDPNDAYDMAVDSAGHIHLLASGYMMGSEQPGAPTPQAGASGLYQFEWDGQNWYPPNLLYRGGWLPEYPKLVIDHGNQLHAVWYLRQGGNSAVPYQIMYAHGVSSSPRTEPQPLPTLPPADVGTSSGAAAPLRPSATPELAPTATWVASTPASAASLYSEWGNYGLILLSILPVVGLIIGVAIIARKRSM